ncbi:hypothetical protein HC823_01450 [Candidatus Gracilibacteria bacterium]|nr:hypothetical protein [Candidatus Gracilibacteria bacterium]
MKPIIKTGLFFESTFPKRPAIKQTHKLFNFEINSRLGVPAGPLLNSHWCDIYAQLGFDLPVYKTVRSIERACHPNPNCIFLDTPTQFTQKDINTEIHPGTRPNYTEDITITTRLESPLSLPVCGGRI